MPKVPEVISEFLKYQEGCKGQLHGNMQGVMYLVLNAMAACETL